MTITTDQARNILTGASKPGAPTNNAAEVAITSWYLENTSPGHNKFYLCMVSDAGHSIMVWGRIGSNGQSKIEKYTSYKDAETVALKQVYAKASKGYAIKEEQVKFAATAGLLADTLNHNKHDGIMSLRRRAQQDPQFQGEQQTATRHYDNFITAAETLMAKATTSDLGALFDEWQALQDAWAELDAKHGTAATTLTLTSQILQQRLLSGV